MPAVMTREPGRGWNPGLSVW